MMEFTPKTYNDALRMARCKEVCKYIPNLTQEQIMEMYCFISEDPNHLVLIFNNLLYFRDANGAEREIYPVEPITGFDSLTMGSSVFKVLTHFQTSRGGTSGISGNNNNNNNNNNNG